MKYWTKDEDVRLLEMARQHKTPVEIGREMGRSRKGVWCRLHRLRGQGTGIHYPVEAKLARIETGRMHPLVRRVLEKATREEFCFKSLGERSGVSHQTIRNWPNSVPRLDTFIAVAEAAGFKVKLEAA